MEPAENPSELPSLPSGLAWEYYYTDEPPFVVNYYKVIPSAATTQPTFSSLPLQTDSKPKPTFELGQEIRVDNEDELPELTYGLKWQYQYTDEPPFSARIYVVVRAFQFSLVSGSSHSWDAAI